MGKSRTFNPEKYIGRKFNRWTVIEYDHCEERKAFNKKRGTYNNLKYHFFKVECDCGSTSVLRITALTTGKSKSCGCFKKDMMKGKTISKTHGKTNHPLYVNWRAMKYRCLNSHYKFYNRYGGRGIKICDEWLDDFMNFYNWSIQNGYKKGLTLDRIDNDGNYEPSNCRWATQKEQTNNTSKNVNLIYEGEIKTASEWSKVFNVKPEHLYYKKRIGKSDEDIFKELEKVKQ
ncbi:hypothetical protein [Mammaliicoccus sciuri]|uniref:hypothetical protein n=1 Tax=Mammaliicoccus sciuri TaxID=1296 RepID=UPI0019130A8C|nr:hypothetical protein [Mammaliicoccus sciuri]